MPIENSLKTIAAIVQDRIREAILQGHLSAGSRIDQNQLANDLSVSLVPIREALKKLEAEGFVQIIPRRGAFVSETSLNDMADLYFTRAVLEGQAAYHAAERLSAADLAEMDRLMAQMNEALSTHDYQQFTECNRRFHFIMYNAAGSKYLVNMITGLWDLAERYRYRYFFFKDQAAVIQAEHQAILDACHQQQKEDLRNAIIAHLNQTLVGIRRYIESAENNPTAD